MNHLKTLLTLFKHKITTDYPDCFVHLLYSNFTYSSGVCHFLKYDEILYEQIKKIVSNPTNEEDYYFYLKFMKNATSASVLLELRYFTDLQQYDFLYLRDDNIKNMVVDITIEHDFLERINF